MNKETKNVEIVYKLIDEVSKDITLLRDQLEQTENQANQTEGFDNLTGKIVKANLATQVLLTTFQLFRQGLGEIVEIASEGASLDMMNQTLDVVASNMGYTAEEVNKFRDALDEANAFGSDQTRIIKTLMQTGLIPLIETLEFANGKTGFQGLVGSIKDFAAAAQVSSSTALKDFSTAIQRLEPLLLDKYFTMRNLNFVYQDYANLVGKSVIELSEQEKRTAFLNEIIRESATQMGVYSETYDTAGKNLISMTNIVENLREELGLQLQPTFKVLTSTMVNSLKSIRDYIKENPNFVQNVIMVTGALGGLITALVVIPKVMTLVTAASKIMATGLTVTQLRVGALGIALVAFGALAASAFAKQVSAQAEADSATQDLNGSLRDMYDGAITGADALNSALDENAMKMKQLQLQIQKENEQFNKQLADIVDARRDAIAENEKLLEEEKKSFEEKQNDREEKYKETTDKLKEQNEARLKDLEDTLGQELQAGSSTYDEQLAKYKQMIADEQLAGDFRLQEAKTAYDEETIQLQDEYSKRTTALEAQIATDEELLNKHAELIKTINRDILLDEIEQLKKTHEDRLAELKTQLQKENAEWASHAGSVSGTYDELMQDIKDSTNGLTADLAHVLNIEQMLKDMGYQIAVFFDSIVRGIFGVFVDTAANISRGIFEFISNNETLQWLLGVDKNWAGKQIKDVEWARGQLKGKEGDVLRSLGVSEDEINRIYGHATGTGYWKGGITKVNERGGEIIDLPQGTRIYPADKSQEMMGEKNITIVNNYPEGVPASMIVNRLMFQIKSLT